MPADAHLTAKQVCAAQNDPQAADKLIEQYMPFIKSEAAKFLKRTVCEQDDELSIAMFAFYEAIKNYSRLKGSFLKYASLRIRHRLIDNYRSEKKNAGNISLDTPIDSEGENTLLDTLQDEDTPIDNMEIREATVQEIAHLTKQMEEFGVSLSDVADNSPQQKRTLAACQKVIAYARAHTEILDEFLAAKKIPITRLAKETGVEKKTLERHRRYLVAALLICTNGYEIMRSHIVQVLKGGIAQ